jgi:hypothetical protein
MNKIWILALAVIMITVCSGCKKNFLDKMPDEDLTIDDVFSQFRYAESFLTSVYFDLPEEWNMSDASGRNPFVAATDEMHISQSYAFSHSMATGAWGPSNMGLDIWGFMYEGIRKANIFLENVDRVPFSPPTYTEAARDRWKGEAIFLRAFYHFMLMRTYGPVPIADKAYLLADDFQALRRQPLQQCIDFVVSECDKAATSLPLKITNASEYGRITKAAALALKARVLLYAASPLWNGNPDYAGFKDNEGIALFPASADNSRWQRAYQAAKDCIDQTEAGGYQIFRQTNTDPVKACQDLFLVNNNSEIFLARNCGVSLVYERVAFPLSRGGYSSYCPLQEIVDDYEMENGEKPILGYNADHSAIINPVSGYTETGYAATAHPKGYYPAGVSNMYVNRDPRFYANIHYSGSIWQGQQIQFWRTGLDGRGTGGQNYSTTGYLIKKFSDPNVSVPANRGVLKTWVFFRLGEQYLNYAEALNEYEGAVPDVYKYVNLIRQRAGMPALPAGLSKEAMRERIRQERRIELAFETHRYFDLHRWKLSQTVDNKDVYGMSIQNGTSLQDNSFYKRTTVEKRIFIAPRHYLWPIYQSEINKNNNLVQNPQW